MDDNFDSDLKIMPPLWDRNYNTNLCFYEIVNELTNPVLQVIYTAPNIVRINGIFQEGGNSIYESFGGAPTLYTFAGRMGIVTNNQTNAFSDGIVATVSLDVSKFSEFLYFSPTDSPVFIGEIMTNELYRPTFPGQRAFFTYPSNEHPGELADWVKFVQTSKGTYLVNPANRSELLPMPKTFGTKMALGIMYGTIIAGILWMCFGWIFYRKRSNIKSP